MLVHLLNMHYKPYILAECAAAQLSPVRRLVWTCLYGSWNYQVACCNQCSICWTAALVRMPSGTLCLVMKNCL